MSLKPGHFKIYSTPENSFWCCVGTGMENHSKYGDTIYFHDADSLWVNLFIASELNWAEKGISVRQETKFPESDTTVLKFKAAAPSTFALKIRHPAWATDGMKISVNGKKQKIESAPGSYSTVQREWRDGDTVKIQLPMRLHAESLPETTNEIALLYGPIVLAGELGTNGMPRRLLGSGQGDFNRVPDPSVPMFAATPDELLKHVKPVRGEPLTFRTDGIGRPDEVTLMPFYELHHQRYSVYWNLISEAEWKAQSAQIADADARRMAEEARVVDVVRPGEQQSETDHKMQGDDTQTGDYFGLKWRHAAGWFSYEMKCDPVQPQQLVVTFFGGDAGREFDVMVDGKVVGTEKLNNNKPGEFFDATFPLAPELTRGKSSVTVKFAAHPGSLAGGVFGIRMIRAK